ncbi:carbamate kinase [Kosmotoga arenicorallina S304]|uniref:Carbamate kinase n=1 Tax=Kosmotoga arenicorallina S304 TaxID=1453497 RepID=A0A182C766_9BACT|nr:carbamate kinase [Kosmotoga arenicorallina]OAA31349.1 carbamate kinase [Kosmotoga arenicorallina S304]
MKKIVVAIGGNALNKPGEKPTAEVMKANLLGTVEHLADLIEDGFDLVITHGNGPQVGNLLVQQELAKDTLPPFPIDVNDAMTQGSIGYLISQTLSNELKRRGLKIPVSCVLTQVVVDKNDPGFENPTKPVGPFYDEKTARDLQKNKGWVMKEDAGRGWRRVVPSPKPLDIVEIESIKALLEADNVLIAAGGGGIPVVMDNAGKLEGVEAVIDKDRASSLLARLIGADTFVILTAVDHAYLNFGKKDQKALKKLKVSDAKRLMEEGHFAKGSMYPKVEAAVDFVESTGHQAIITSLEGVKEALEGTFGTHITI